MALSDRRILEITGCGMRINVVQADGNLPSQVSVEEFKGPLQPSLTPGDLARLRNDLDDLLKRLGEPK